jgi:Mn2+/Fe2+ NRAMP family transporter
VVAVTLLPVSLVFLLLILNDEAFMGEYVNNRWQNVTNWSIVIVVITASSLMGISTLFPGLFE